MNFERLAVERGARGIATLTLNRPDRGNAYDDVMLRELMAELGALDNDDDVRVVVVRGSGKHFCVGADIGWHRANQQLPAAEREAGPKLIEMLLALDRLTKPTIAVVQGAAVGGGLAIPLCCDVALAHQEAFFSIPEVRIGLMPGPLVPLFLRAMPYRAFRRYGLSGERFSSAEAKSLGLIHSVAAADAIEAVLAKQIEEFLASAPGAIAGLKLLSAKLAPPAFTPELLHQPIRHPRESGGPQPPLDFPLSRE
jgi:methylglutaconyl-CoA hydratase